MCTNLLLSVPVSPGSSTPRVYVSARLFEITPNFPTAICLVPTQAQFPNDSMGNPTNPYQWSNKYGFVGVTPLRDSIPLSLFTDGLNQAGLSVGALWFPGAAYPASAGQDNEVWFSDLPAWMLGNFSSAADIQQALQAGQITVVGPPAPTNGGKDPGYFPVHFIATDNTGQSLIIEFVGPTGQMMLYGPGQPDNIPSSASGVLTNFPPYDEQINNLSLYQNLTLLGSTTTVTGSGPPVGSGIVGLPGDPTPQSRFVRAAIMSDGFSHLPSDGSGWLPAPDGGTVGFADSVQTAVNVALQLVQIAEETPYGMLLAGTPAAPGDWTQWTVARDHTNLNYYFTSTFNNVPQVIRFDNTSFDPVSGWKLPSAATIPLNPPDTTQPWCYPASFPSSP